MATAKAIPAMQNITKSHRSSRVQFIAVLIVFATLATFATAASRQISHNIHTSREHSSPVRTFAGQMNQGQLVPCPGGENICPGGTLAPASLFLAR